MARIFSKARLFRWHATLGVCCGSLLFLICFSGSVAVFSDEIDWLIRPCLHVAPAETDWEAARNSLEEAYPDYQLVSLVKPLHAGFPVRAYARTAAGSYVNLYADPGSGEALRAESYWNVQRFLRSLHRRLFLPQPYGVITLSVFAVFLGVLVYTGLKTLGRKWRNFFPRVRWKGGAKAVLADVHRLLGVWSWFLAAILSVTGIWYGVELVAPAPYQSMPELPESRREARTPASARANLNRMVEAGRRSFEGFAPERVYLGGPDRPALVMGYAEAGSLLRPRANVVAVDPANAEVLGSARSSEAGVHKWISELADPVHFGDWGGLATQGVWFVLGLAVSFSIPLGMVLAFKRIPNKRLPGAGVLWISGVLSLGFVGYAIWGGFAEYRDWNTEDVRFVPVARMETGPWQWALYAGALPGKKTGTGDFRMTVATEAHDFRELVDFAAVTLTAGAQSGNEPLEIRFSRGGGSVARQYLVGEPKGEGERTPDFASRWRMELTGLDGTAHVAEFSPSRARLTEASGEALAGPPPVAPAVNVFVGGFALVSLGSLALTYLLMHRALKSGSEDPACG